MTRGPTPRLPLPLRIAVACLVTLAIWCLIIAAVIAAVVAWAIEL
jgi:hypothetical protein